MATTNLNKGICLIGDLHKSLHNKFNLDEGQSYLGGVFPQNMAFVMILKHENQLFISIIGSF